MPEERTIKYIVQLFSFKYSIKIRIDFVKSFSIVMVRGSVKSLVSKINSPLNLTRLVCYTFACTAQLSMKFKVIDIKIIRTKERCMLNLSKHGIYQAHEY